MKIYLKYRQTYICPIRHEQFSVESRDQSRENPLPLEDAPPKSLRGKASILTRRKCNNACGQQIDHHLHSKLTELDHKKFIPGVTYKAILENEGVRVFGIVSVDENNSIRVEHDKLKNNPVTLKVPINYRGRQNNKYRFWRF